MVSTSNIAKLRGRIAEAGLRRQDLAALLGYSETMFSLYLNGRRPAPPDFEANVYAAIDRLETAEKAAQEARGAGVSGGRGVMSSDEKPDTKQGTDQTGVTPSLEVQEIANDYDYLLRRFPVDNAALELLRLVIQRRR